MTIFRGEQYTENMRFQLGYGKDEKQYYITVYDPYLEKGSTIFLSEEKLLQIWKRIPEFIQEIKEETKK